jgi:hypothetical protein
MKKDVVMLTLDNPRWLVLLSLLAMPVGCGDAETAQTPAQPAQPTLQADPAAAPPPEADGDDGDEAGDDEPDGRWRRAPKREVTDEQLEQLQAIGYLEGYEPAPDVTGITRYDKPKVTPGPTTSPPPSPMSPSSTRTTATSTGVGRTSTTTAICSPSMRAWAS